VQRLALPVAVRSPLSAVSELPDRADGVRLRPRSPRDRRPRRLRAPDPLMELGLLPALGGGIGELRGTGQASRLIDGYLRAYVRAFPRVWYFSYLPEALGDFTDDGTLCEAVRVLAPARPRPRLVRALEMTTRHRREFRRAAVLRVFQLTGILPALAARARWG